MKYFSEAFTSSERGLFGIKHQGICFSTLIGAFLLITTLLPEKALAIQRHQLYPDYIDRNVERTTGQYQTKREGSYRPLTAHRRESFLTDNVSQQQGPAYNTGDNTRPGEGSGRFQKEEQGIVRERQLPVERPVAREKTHEQQAIHKKEDVSQKEGVAVKEEVRKKEENIVKISPIPGVTFTETLIKLLDHELNGRFLGWRPNDLIIGRFTDNVNNYQLGVLEAVRITAIKLKESLSRLGESDAYDPDLEIAVNLLMNKATSFWFPSAESSYKDALDHLRKYEEKLKTGRAHFYYRVDTLLSLVSIYRDFLGNVNNNLIRKVSWFKADDYFYYAQGVANVMYNILQVVRLGFHNQLVTIDGVDIMNEVIHELHRGVSMSPWIILNRPLDSLFANHRANLSAVLGEATHLLSTIAQL